MNQYRKPCGKSRRGATLIELVLVCLLFAFLVAATTKLYHVGEDQQLTARFYSDAQANCREALRRIVRSVRHGFAVEGANDTIRFYSGDGTTEARASSANEIIVAVPQPGNTTGRDHIRFYVRSGTLYAQRSDDTGLGLEIATGVQSLAFRYFETTNGATGATTTPDCAPTAATEVQVSLTLTSGTVRNITRIAYVELRNASLGL